MTLRSKRKSSLFWIIFIFFRRIYHRWCRSKMRRAYGPNKTLYNRFIRWSRLGVFELCLP